MNTINNNIAFRGTLGNKIVKDITENQRIVDAKEILQMTKSKLVGLNTEKVTDIFESMSDGLLKESQEKTSLKMQLKSLSESIPQKIETAVNDVRNKMQTAFDIAMNLKNVEIQAKDEELAKLRIYESMAKVKSLDEIDTVMPETAITTVREMKEHDKTAKESMLTYLLTGKGQEAALEQADRANVLAKAHSDGINQIPEVMSEIEKSGIHYAEPLYFLRSMMSSVLRTDKGAVVLAPVFKNQIKTNMLALLTPHSNNRYSNTSVDGITKCIERSLEETVTFHKNLAQRKQELTKEFPNASQIIYNNEDNKIELYDSNGKLIESRMFFY